MLALRGFATVQRWHPEVLVSRVCWFNIAGMSNFDSKYWNLSQAAAWVVYRNKKLVGEFSMPSPGDWGVFHMYPTMFDDKPVGFLNQLHEALIQGDLTAWGRRNDFQHQLEAIPPREWPDLWIIPPLVKRSDSKGGYIEPWTDLRFESSYLKKLWRGSLETEGRTRYKWDVLEKMWHEINKRLPDASMNERILELQSDYESRYGSAPSRSSIQTHIKRWLAGQSD